MERAELIALVRASGCAVEREGMLLLGDGRAASNIQDRTSDIGNGTSKIEHRTTNGAQPHREGTLNAQRLTLNAQVGEFLEQGWLGIATGGSSGALKFARHDERTLTAAVNGFCAHFELEQVNAVDVLPAYHVSGLMARVRCAATGGEHVAWDWKRLEAGERPALAEGKSWVISLVPTQLQRLLASPEAVTWLRGFKIIFIGGGPVWPELTIAAAKAELPLSLSYGMTETAAMVAALKPDEFLAGARSCGRPLPHVKINLVEDDLGSSGEGAPKAEGVVRVVGESVFRGYFLANADRSACHLIDDKRGWVGGDKMGEKKCEFVTEDLGLMDERGHLHILGRRDAVIISGGKKVQPAEVEAALRASGEFSDVAVIGVPDAEWGEIVVACYQANGKVPDVTRAVAGLTGFLRPKRFVALAEWPRNAQGKINRAELKRMVASGRVAPN